MFDAKKRVTELRKDLQELCKQRDYTNRQIINVRLALRSLSLEIKDQREREEISRELAAAARKPGLTARIAECLREMPYVELSAAEVREWLEREGVDLGDYSQPLATVAITLNRMAENKRIRLIRDGRKVTYQWNGD